MAARKRPRKPLRVGKVRKGGRRGWQARLQAPSGEKRYRVRFKNPATGEWRELHAVDRDEANEVFENVEAWLDAGAPGAAEPGIEREEDFGEGPQDIEALARRLLRRMHEDRLAIRTLDNAERTLRVHILPVIGSTAVLAWDSEDCRRVLRRARQSGLAPATVQDVGKFLTALVREAHTKPRWLPLTNNPMEGVPYRARSRHQGQAAVYIPASERPTTEHVRALCFELWRRGRRVGRPWYLTMGLIAGFSGLRWSELIGLRPLDYDPDARILVVTRAIAQADSGDFVVKPPKNEKEREVPVPGSTHRRLVKRIGDVLAAPPGDGPWPVGGPEGLLFLGPNAMPWTRSTWRRGPYTHAARGAAWEMVGDTPTASGLQRGGSPRLPWRNLRHHAATWLHHEVGLEWEDISHILGHHSVAFTLDTYVRRGVDADERRRERLDRY
ncbi:MAG: tyrosine-type recombinase/integrase [Actinobacteria bacterium]|nr:tyrosine-type recombinase/integrase [Actinomycetota bacterium]